ncbi:hypothetical protein D1872_204300 [compost metagenome]
MASSANLAATSATRSEPFVITKKLINVKIKKTTKPTIALPPITNEPNDSITFPASPCDRMFLVDDTFNARRNSVVIKSNDGKIENCEGSFVFIATNKIVSDSEILIIKRTSRRGLGMGITSIMTIQITNPIITRSLRFICFPPSYSSIKFFLLIYTHTLALQLPPETNPLEFAGQFLLVQTAYVPAVYSLP